MFTPQGKARKRAANPVDGYFEDRYGRRDEDDSVGQADECESEDDSDFDLGRRFRRSAAPKRSLKNFEKQAKRPGDSEGKSERQRRKHTFDSKKHSTRPSKKDMQQSKSTRSFGMFGSSSSAEGQKRKRVSDESMLFDRLRPLPDLVDFDSQESDLEDIAPQNTSNALKDFLAITTPRETPNPLADFLAAKPERNTTAQRDEGEESSPDPISNLLYDPQSSVSSKKQHKTSDQGRPQRKTISRPKTRAVLKQQLKDQDKEKKDVRRSGRNLGASQPFYSKKPSGNSSNKRVSASTSAKKTRANTVQDNVAYELTEWPKKLDKGKVLVDLRGIDQKQYVRY